MRRTAAVLSLVVALAAVAPAGAAAVHPATDGGGGTASQTSAYAGTHVSFDASGRAIADYSVGDATMVQRLTVQSRESAESSGLVTVGASLSAVTSLEGSRLTLASKTEARASVRTEGSARVTAHDNHRGILVVASGGESQYVLANVSEDASTTADGDAEVHVTTGNGTEGTFVVVGDGSVTVNDEGDVSAELGEDGRLVFRAYPGGKSADDDRQEALVAEGTAAAEVYVTSDGEGTVTDAVTYAGDTTVEARQSAEGTVEVTVDRTVEEGTVVITSVSEAAVGSVSDLQVNVDGEAAVQASSYEELEGAIGGERSTYLVRQRTGASARAGADVLVAVDHFSERTVTIAGGESDAAGTTTDGRDGNDSDGSDDGDGSDSSDGTDGSDSADGDGASDGGDATATGGQPGFGLGVALLALAGAALLARRR